MHVFQRRVLGLPSHRLLATLSTPTVGASPLAVYEVAVQEGKIREDERQRSALSLLDRLHHSLCAFKPPPPPPPPPPPKESKWAGPTFDAYGEPIGGGTFYTGVANAGSDEGGWWSRITSQLAGGGSSGGGETADSEPPLGAVEAPQGVYLYGGVGCGKSMMMDLFFDGCPVPCGAAPTWKRRLHFHELMVEVHRRAHELRQQNPNMGDPVPYLAHDITCETQLLCLDEFHVTDVADALMLRKLFRRLFSAGLVLVATSNRAPSDLYASGIHRQSFLGFISDLEMRCKCHDMAAALDYRTIAQLASGVASLTDAGTTAYVHALGTEASALMETVFAALTDGGAATEAEPIRLRGRRLQVQRACGHVARFSFAELCESALGPEDFLAIARAYPTVLVEEIPQLSLRDTSSVRRLITMVDAFYDARVRLVVSAAVPLDQLFEASGGVDRPEQTQHGDLIGTAAYVIDDRDESSFAFRRASSRLQEMQSNAYWDAAGYVARQERSRRR